MGLIALSSHGSQDVVVMSDPRMLRQENSQVSKARLESLTQGFWGQQSHANMF